MSLELKLHQVLRKVLVPSWKNTMKIFPKITCRHPKCGKTRFRLVRWKYWLLLTSCKPTSIHTLKYWVKHTHWHRSSFLQPDYNANYLDHSTGNHYIRLRPVSHVDLEHAHFYVTLSLLLYHVLCRWYCIDAWHF